MKNHAITLLALATLVSSVSTTHARSFMPKIEQLRNKIETISQNTPAANLKELLAAAHIERDAQGNVHKIITFDQSSNDALSLEQEIKALYWCNHTQFIEQAQTKQTASKAERQVLLFKELSQKYPNNNRAVLTFATDLAAEETKLNDLTTRILKAMGDEKKSPTAGKLNELLQTVTKLKQNHQIITIFVNDAFTA